MSEWSRCLPYAHLIDLLVQPSPGLLIYSQITPMGICNRNYITPNKCTVMNKCLAVSAGYLNCRIAARFRQISSTILYDALPYTDPFRWQPYIFGRKYDNKAPANGLAPLSTRASADAVITKFVFRRYTAVSLEVVNYMDVIKKSGWNIYFSEPFWEFLPCYKNVYVACHEWSFWKFVTFRSFSVVSRRHILSIHYSTFTRAKIDHH